MGYYGRYIFVSHAKADHLVVDGLIQQLRSRGIEVWEDLEQNYDGDTDRVLGDAITHCSIFVVLITAASVRRPWVRWEVRRALNDADLPIMPVYWDIFPYRIPEPFGDLTRHSPVLLPDAAAAIGNALSARVNPLKDAALIT